MVFPSLFFYDIYILRKFKRGFFMIRIAICDDEQSMVRQNEEIVRNSLQACGIGYEIVTYSQSTNLLCDIIEDKFFYD